MRLACACVLVASAVGYIDYDSLPGPSLAHLPADVQDAHQQERARERARLAKLEGRPAKPEPALPDWGGASVPRKLHARVRVRPRRRHRTQS